MSHSPNTATAVSNPILEGVIWKQLLKYFFPILFGTFFQQLYNTADALIVGRFLGKEALSAVAGSSGMIVQLVVGFFVGLSSGASVLVSQYYGAYDKENVRKSVHTVMAFSFLCGALMMVIGLMFSPVFLQWMKTPEDTMEMSVIYLRVYFAGMIGNMIYNTGSGILRAAGDSRRPLYFLIVSCVGNIILDALFIIPMKLGVFGAALATIVSQFFSAILVLLVLMRTNDLYRFSFSSMTIDPKTLSSIIRIGLPSGLQCVMYGLSNIIIQIGVNGLGTATVAAWASYYKIDGIFWMTVGAFGISITTFTGQNYGAGNRKRIFDSIKSCMFMALLSSVVISAVVWLICPWLLPLFITDAEVQHIGVDMMRYLTRFYFLYVSVEILSGALRGVGDTVIPMLLCLFGICILRSAWILFVLPVHHDMYTMMNSYPISWIVTSLAFFLYLPLFSRLRIQRKKDH